VDLLYGENDHHKIESVFKGFGRAMKKAVQITSDDLQSTKGAL
jgi:imidazoleglycerol-phosphate dehydratase